MAAPVVMLIWSFMTSVWLDYFFRVSRWTGLAATPSGFERHGDALLAPCDADDAIHDARIAMTIMIARNAKVRT